MAYPGENVFPLIPVGILLPFAGPIATIPTDWLPCDGSVISRTTFARLFDVLGTLWNTGGEAGTDFRLPDFRGKSPIGTNNANLPNGANGGFTTRNPAAIGGVESVSAHTHSQNAHSHGLGNSGGVGPSATVLVDNDGGGSQVAVGNSIHKHDGGNTENASAPVSDPAGAVNLFTPFAVCTYIIKT